MTVWQHQVIDYSFNGVSIYVYVQWNTTTKYVMKTVECAKIKLFSVEIQHFLLLL